MINATKKWIFLKVSGAILIPLMVWFIFNFIKIYDESYLNVVKFFTNPLSNFLFSVFIIDAFSQELTTGKLYYFLHGDRFGDWRDLKFAYQSDHYLNFNLYNEELNHIVTVTLKHIRSILRIVYPLIFCFLIAYSVSRKNIILFKK